VTQFAEMYAGESSHELVIQISFIQNCLRIEQLCGIV